MKLQLRNTILLGALALTAASCSDYLETAPEDLFASDSFYQTAAQCEQGVYGVYADFRTIDCDLYLYLSECRSDNLWVTPLSNALREYCEIGTFRADYTLATIESVWEVAYKTIYDANIAIQSIPNCTFNDTAIQDQFLGEMYFIRGWMYLELARIFGNIPLVDQPLSSSDIASLAQSTPQEIFEGIVIPDLQKAIELLPYQDDLLSSTGASASGNGRADKVAAQAMLARAYMTLIGYPYNDTSYKSAAKTLLKTIVDYSDSTGEYWADDYLEWQKQWMPTSEYKNKYSIFAIQHELGELENYFVFNSMPITYATNLTTIRIYGNSIYIEKQLEYEYERVYSGGNTDLRGEGHTTLITFEPATNEDQYTNVQAETTTMIDEETAEVWIYTMLYKWLPSIPKLAELGISFDEGQLSSYYDWPVNYPVLRIEDMMLLYAELLCDDGDYTSAMDIVNKIRTRAGCDAETASSASEALELVKRERRVELCGEGVRWFDMVRYGDWRQTIIDMFADYNNPDGTDTSNVKAGRYLYPIPQEQMNAVTIYVQNEDYD